ncbi:MAG: helix-turn-helix transcriptional regulator [Bauldia sp.]|nr:helix-turn-helix transcriptional regulator [Bauldia sp.]
MRSYGQFCPIAKTAEIFCERWTALILRDLVAGATRFSQLRRGVPLASPTLLSRRLKELEAEGIVERRRSQRGASWTYHLTPAGREFAPIIEGLGIWGQRWSRRELEKHEMDLTLLMWSLEVGVRPEAFGQRRCVVKLTFADQPEGVRDWWFINEDRRVELCIEEPGVEVDLYLGTTLADMIYLYRGDLSLATALGQGRLDVHGPAWARHALPRWLAPSRLSREKSLRPDAVPV